MGNTPGLLIEAMDGSNIWNDITSDVMPSTLDFGMAPGRAVRPVIGKYVVTLKNTSRAYNPGGMLDLRRRLRVKATGASLGKCLQAIHSGAYGVPDTTTIVASGISLPIGNNGGTTFRQAQSFQIGAGQLKIINFTLNANVGTPSSTMTWEIRDNNSTSPGGLVSIVATGQTAGIGNVGGIVQRQAESFIAIGGRLIAFDFKLGANNAAPTGGLTWELRDDNAKSGPGPNVLATGTIATPTASATNSVTITGGPILNTGQRYWLVLYATTPAGSGNYWNWQTQAAGTYYNGNLYQSVDLGFSYALQSGYNAQCSFTTAALGPGSNVLATGTLTPVASSSNTINPLPTPPALVSNTIYWLVLYSTNAQTSGNYWQWQAASASTYANGNTAQSSDAGANWTMFPAQDAACSFLTDYIHSYFWQNVTMGIVVSDAWTLQWDARAQFDSQYNVDKVAVTTDAEISPWTPYTYSNKWATYSLSWTTTLTGTVIGTRHEPFFTGNGLNSTLIEYRNIKLTRVASTVIAATGATCGIGTNGGGGVIRCAQSLQVPAGTVTQIILPLTVNTGTPTGTMTWEIRTDAGGTSGPGTLLATGTFTPVPSTDNVIPVTNGPTLAAGTKYWLVAYSTVNQAAGNAWNGKLSTSSVYANGNFADSANGGASWVDFPADDMSWTITTLSANVLVNGDFSNGLTGWSQSNNTTPPASGVISVVNDTWIKFNGLIERIDPSTMANAGPLTSTVTCVDWTATYQYKTLDVPVQKNQMSDQLAATLYALLPTGTLNTTPVGKVFVAGKQSFQRAFDQYTKNQTTVFDGLTDIATSEHTRWWTDADGTLRMPNRDYWGFQVSRAPVLTLTGKEIGTPGLPINIRMSSDVYNIINKAIMSFRPRLTGGAVQAIGQAQGVITLPPGSPTKPSRTTVTLTYRDAAGNTIGGDSVITPIPGTDWHAWEGPAETGGYDYTLTGVVYVTDVVISSSQITMVFNNNATGNLYITFLQVRGNPIYTYDATTVTLQDAASITAYQDRPVSINLPFSNDIIFATNLGLYLVNQYKNPFTEAVDFSADNEVALGGVDLLSLELFDVVTVSDAQSAQSATKHQITHIYYELDPDSPNGLKKAIFSLERMDQQTYWILGIAGYSELGSTTWLYI